MKLFTPEEANRALEVVRPLVERMVEARRQLLRLDGELDHVRTTVAGNGGGLDPGEASRAQAAAEKAIGELETVLTEIDALGVQVKDLDRGLVDFPARHPEGATVLLCWHLGEDDIRFWHGWEEGFAGRKPLPF